MPNQQITRLLHCKHKWNKSQRCFLPVLDAFGETSVPNIYVAGDGAGIGGAKVAAMQGRLVALRIANKAGKSSVSTPSHWRPGCGRSFRYARFSKRYMPLQPRSASRTTGRSYVDAKRLRQARSERLWRPAYRGRTQVKSLLRTGMGPCQGRFCGLALSEIVAEGRSEEPSTVGYYRIRSPLKPLRLTELANLGATETSPTPLKQEDLR